MPNEASNEQKSWIEIISNYWKVERMNDKEIIIKKGLPKINKASDEKILDIQNKYC